MKVKENFQDIVEKALNALTVYVAHGEAAAKFLQDGNIPACVKTMNERLKVFHNFRAIDYILKLEGIDLAKDSRFVELGKIVTSVNASLSDLFLECSDETRRKLQKISNAQNVIANYQSGTPVKNKFQKVS